jgi:outer membrane immunogenic protein
MKRVLTATLGLLAISAVPAAAADLPVKARPMVPVVTAYNWTGCHIGGNVGGKWARTSGSVDVGPTGTGVGLGAPGTVVIGQGDSSSVIAGGQVGCDYQAAGSNWVFGIEGDFDWQRLSRTNTLVGAQPFPFVAGDFYDWRSDWQASIRGRIGYAFDRVMIYATGGGAFTNVKVGSNFIALTTAGINFPAAFGSDGKTIAGWTFGGGFEYAFINNWSFGIEGRYSWYGTHQFSGPPLATVFTPANGAFTFAQTSQSVKLETFEVMAKLNWKFM